MSRKVRFGVIGLGHIAQGAILPAFASSPVAEVVAGFSGDAGKAAKLAEKHAFAGVYSYQDLERGLKEQRCDAAFIAVPNSLHREYAERCAAARVHVLCEKPLAVTSADCEAMGAAARHAGVKLMVAYRHHFSEAFREAIRLAREGTLGELRSVHSLFTIAIAETSHKILGVNGGTLPDIGIYCINTIRNVMQAEPVKIAGFTTTRADDPRFREVEEMFTAVMEFPGSRLATFTCEFGAARVMTLELIGTKGSARFEPFYDYRSAVTLDLRVDGKTESRTYAKADQFAGEIDHFSRCVLNDVDPAQSAGEAVADTRVMEALRASAARAAGK